MAREHPELPRYVARGGEIVYCPPGIATGVRMYAFMLLGGRRQLDRVYHRNLTEPSGRAVDYEPAGPLIVLNFTTLAHVGAQIPPDLERGFFLENEVAIWSLGYDSVHENYSAFVPYMFVDQGSAMAMGREVYGFPKQLGVVDMPADPEVADSFNLRVPGVKEWGQDEQFAPHDLISIKQVDGATQPITHDFVSQVELLGEMAALVRQDPGIASVAADPGVEGDLDHAARAMEFFSAETLPMVFLKQIRDATTPLRACFQSVHVADFVVTAFRGAGRLPGMYEININELANEPMRRDLGIADGTITPIGAFWVDFDFTLTIADELWRAGVPPTVQARTGTSSRGN